MLARCRIWIFKSCCLQEEKRKWPEQLQKLTHASEAPANGVHANGRVGDGGAAPAPQVDRVPARGIVANVSCALPIHMEVWQQAEAVPAVLGSLLDERWLVESQ